MTIKLLLMATFFFALFSCENKKDGEAQVLSAQTTTADAKSLMTSFEEAWNKDDSAAVANMMADDVLLISGKTKFKGKKEITDNWISRHIPITTNLKITDHQAGAGSDIVYSTGTWQLDIMQDGKLKGTSFGNHTFLWKKQDDGSHKLILLNMEDTDAE